MEDQIELLRERGMAVRNEQKATEILLDIGYYRLGFYLFPFEETYPKLSGRNHRYIKGSTLEDVVSLYYFDFDLRLILMRYLTRIEVAFRTAMVYVLSNKYRSNNVWFIDPAVVEKGYAVKFEQMVYTPDFKRNPIIHRHHRRHPNDRFAPAWKTLEFMTFGAVIKLYERLKNKEDKIEIANRFGIRQVVTFENYIHTIRHVRNACAHGLLLYDMKLPVRIKKGPAILAPSDSGNIIGALKVIKCVMEHISINRAADMKQYIASLYERLCSEAPRVKNLIPDFSVI